MSTEGGLAGWVGCDLLQFKELGPGIRPNANEVKVEGLILTQSNPWESDRGGALDSLSQIWPPHSPTPTGLSPDPWPQCLVCHFFLLMMAWKLLIRVPFNVFLVHLPSCNVSLQGWAGVCLVHPRALRAQHDAWHAAGAV